MFSFTHTQTPSYTNELILPHNLLYHKHMFVDLMHELFNDHRTALLAMWCFWKRTIGAVYRRISVFHCTLVTQFGFIYEVSNSRNLIRTCPAIYYMYPALSLSALTKLYRRLRRPHLSHRIAREHLDYSLFLSDHHKCCARNLTAYPVSLSIHTWIPYALVRKLYKI